MMLLLAMAAWARPLDLGRPTADTALDLRLQQIMVTDRLGVEVWLQADQRVEVTVDGGEVRYVATPRLVDAMAQSDFGRVADADLAGQLDLAPLTWVEDADGTIAFDQTAGGSAEVVQQVAGAMGRLSLPRPDRPVPEGGSWTTDRHLDIPLEVEVRDQPVALTLSLDVHAEHRFVGWTDTGLARVATEGTVALAGTVAQRRIRMGAFARSAAEVHVDPDTGLAHWAAGRMEMTATTDGDRRPDRVSLTWVIGVPGEDHPGVCPPGRHLAETGHCGGPHRTVPAPVGRYPWVVTERDGAWLVGLGHVGDPFADPPEPLRAAPWAWWSGDTLTVVPPPFEDPHLALALDDGAVVAMVTWSREPDAAPRPVRFLPPGATTWEDRATPPASLRGVSVTLVDGVVEAVGPEGSWTWDPARDRWSEGPTLPTPRVGADLLAEDGRLVACGGVSSVEPEGRTPVPGCVERVRGEWKPAKRDWPGGRSSHAVVGDHTWVTSVEEDRLTLWELDGGRLREVLTRPDVGSAWVGDRLGQAVVFVDGTDHVLEGDALRPLPSAEGGTWYPRGDTWVVVGGPQHGAPLGDTRATVDRYADVVGAGAGGVVLERDDAHLWLHHGKLAPLAPPEPGRMIPMGDGGWWLGQRIHTFDGETFAPGPRWPQPEPAAFVMGPRGPLAVDPGLQRWEGGRWKALALPDDAPVASLATHEGVLVVGLADGRVFRSDDGGAWEALGRTDLVRPRLTSHAGHLLVHGRRPGTPPDVQPIWDKMPERRTAEDRAVLAVHDDFERLHTARWDGEAWVPVSRSLSDDERDGQLFVVGELLLRLGHDRSRVEILDDALQWRRAPALDHKHFKPVAEPYGNGLYVHSVLGGHEPWDLHGPPAPIPALAEDPEGDAARARDLVR